MLGNLEPEENVMSQGHWLGELSSAIQKLNWKAEDDVVVEIGGVSFSGITQTEGANPKWAKPYGTTSYQDDAFIVIKNRTRKPFKPSIPMSTNTD